MRKFRGLTITVVLVAAVGALAASAATPVPLVGGDTASVVAGTYKFGILGFSGDGGPATKAQLSQPDGVAVDQQGNIYIADAANHRIRKVTTDGTITTIAGGGDGAEGDSFPAKQASFQQIRGVAVDSHGTVYFASSDNMIWRLTGSTVTRFAGDPTRGFGFSGDGGPATKAQLSAPGGVAVDAQGNLYVADTRNDVIRKITPAGIISTVAGNHGHGFSGDGGPATKAMLDNPEDVALDGKGNMYIAERFNYRIRKVDANGTISTIAGIGKKCACSPENGQTATAIPLADVFSVAVDPLGNVYFSDESNITRISVGKTTRVAGIDPNQISRASGIGGPATGATFAGIRQMAFDKDGNLFVSDNAEEVIWKILAGTAKATAKNGEQGKKSKGKPTGKTGGQAQTQSLQRLATNIESYLAQMAADRAKLKTVLTSAATCSLPAPAAAVQVGTVAAGRQRILNALGRLSVPTAQATRIRALLQQALSHSVAADRHYRDWLAGQGGKCPAAQTPALAEAQQEDRLATAAKRQFVAAFDPLARQLHLRVWKASVI